MPFLFIVFHWNVRLSCWAGITKMWLTIERRSKYSTTFRYYKCCFCLYILWFFRNFNFHLWKNGFSFILSKMCASFILIKVLQLLSKFPLFFQCPQYLFFCKWDISHRQAKVCWRPIVIIIRKNNGPRIEPQFTISLKN